MIKKTKLRPFQREVVDKLKDFTNSGHVRGVYNACSQGLGKTVMSIKYIEEMGYKSVLVICPAVLTWNWHAEVKKHSSKKFDLEAISYELSLTARGKEVVFAKEYDLIILDEAHRVKNPHAKSTKLVLDEIYNLKNKPFFMFLSGTPMGNTTADLWTTFSRCLPRHEHFSTYNKFVLRYAEWKSENVGRGMKVKHAVGGKNMEELTGVAKDFFFVRRTKEQVMPELPPKIYTNIYVEADYKPEGDYKKLLKEYEKLLDKDTDEIPNASPYLAREMRQLGAAKVMPGLPFIEELLDAGEVVVCFAYHKCVLDALTKRFAGKYATAEVRGDQADHIRKYNLEYFCKGGSASAQVLVGQINAAGVGLTLVRAPHLVFVESSWSLIAMKQCEDRIHRIGQKANAVNIYRIVARGTLDEGVTKVLDKKMGLFNKTMGE